MYGSKLINSAVATKSTAGLMSAEDKTALDKLKNIQVGGRNLYLGTKDFDGNAWNSIGSWDFSEKYNGFTVASNKYSWDGLGQKITFETGEVYTFSAYVKSKNGAYFFIATDDERSVNTDKNSITIEPSNEFKRTEITFTVLAGGYGSPRIESNLGVAGNVQVCGIKLERGNMATDWTPAPEDADNAIKALNSNTKSVTLSASSWSSGSYTISDSLITSSSNQEILPAVGITADQMKALQKAMIVDAGQSAGSMTITCLGTVPTIDIPIRVIFRGTI